MHNGFHTINYRVADDLTAAVFVPDYELSTEKARQALPTEIPFKDAVHNVSRVSLLPAANEPRDAGLRLASERQRTAVRGHAGPSASASTAPR